MESSSAEGTEIGPPSEAEIAARLERATRSVLASSSLASYSYSQSSAKEELSQRPSLSDLLTHMGHPDSQRCPSCRAPLPFGPRSTLCLACDATIETDFGVAEEDHFLDREAEFSNKSSAANSLAPVEASAQKGLLDVEVSIEQESSVVEKVAAADVQIPLSHTSTTGDISSLTPAETVGSTKKHSSILDYSAKLEGISLEDFFSSQIKQEVPTPPNSDTSSLDLSGTLLPTAGNLGINVQKDSLFWDPLSETIIPDGFDMMTSTREIVTSNDIASDKVAGIEEDDDPFDSNWEGDFQSAPAAAIDTSASQASKPQTFTQPGELEDFFGNFSTTKERGGGERVGFQGNNGWASDTDFFGSSSNTTVGRNTDLNDLLFGSEWQQSMQPSAILATSNGQSTGFFDGMNMLGPLSPVEKEMPGINENSTDFVQDVNSTAAEDMPLTETQASQSAGMKNKIVESLLSQLHNLSFMLTDKLVIKTEGNGKDSKPNSLS